MIVNRPPSPSRNRLTTTADLTGVVTRNGVHHVSISGTASYPCDFASFDVYPDRIRFRVHSLPQQLSTPDTNIHGRPRHAVDYTDSSTLR